MGRGESALRRRRSSERRRPGPAPASRASARSQVVVPPSRSARPPYRAPTLPCRPSAGGRHRRTGGYREGRRTPPLRPRPASKRRHRGTSSPGCSQSSRTRRRAQLGPRRQHRRRHRRGRECFATACRRARRSAPAHRPGSQTSDTMQAVSRLHPQPRPRSPARQPSRRSQMSTRVAREQLAQYPRAHRLQLRWSDSDPQESPPRSGCC